MTQMYLAVAVEAGMEDETVTVTSGWGWGVYKTIE